MHGTSCCAGLNYHLNTSPKYKVTKQQHHQTALYADSSPRGTVQPETKPAGE
jgi:hypothetical protein